MNLLLLWAPALVSAFFIPELLPERVLIPPYDAVGWYHHPVFLDMYYKIQSKKPQDEVGGHKIPNQWDVYLKYDSKITPEAHADWASYLHDEDTGGFHGVGHVFDYPLAEMKGYSGAFTNQTIEKIKKSEVVSTFAAP